MPIFKKLAYRGEYDDEHKSTSTSVTSVKGPIRKVESALDVDAVIQPVAGILAAVGKYIGTLAVALVVGLQWGGGFRGKTKIFWKGWSKSIRMIPWIEVKFSNEGIEIIAAKSITTTTTFHTPLTHPLSGEYVPIRVIVDPHAVRLVLAKLAVIKVSIQKQIAPGAVLLPARPVANILLLVGGDKNAVAL